MAQRPRAIFEEVGTTSRPVAAAPGGIDRGKSERRRLTRAWLVALFVLVVVMVLVGGLTRLTESGLSITEWNLVTGTLPPMSEAAWQSEFDLYLQSPQGQTLNSSMTMADFRSIYWWEWGHRALGRVIGLVFILGYLGLLAAGRIPQGWRGRLLIPGVLIGLQGVIGWWMVSSGLEPGMVSVASTRLALHLGLAFAILAVLLWQALALSRSEAELMTARRSGDRRLVRWGTALVAVLALQIVLGALVAGIDAGRAFPTWPLMGGGFFPPDPFARDPWWINFVEDPGLVQFIHRMTGYVFAVLALLAWLAARKGPQPSLRRAFAACFHMTLLQIALGVFAALTQAQLHVALTHQAGAILLWALVVRARFLAAHPYVAAIRRVAA